MTMPATARHTVRPKPGHLPVMEHFHTIQGEGHHQGRAAYFIRLAGCDVGCVWCDVKDSWDAGAHPQLPVNQLAETASASMALIAVITGGEPLMYDLTELVDTLHAEGLKVHLETSGAHPLSGDIDWITLSPKKFKAPLPEICGMAHELKVVVFNKSDFAWAEDYAAKVQPECLLYLQPEWGREQEVLPLMVHYVKANPKWRISLQTHKYMHVP
jgi:7-carboxy-7-deazaguanine synthase